MGEQVPKCFGFLGTPLSYLYRLATCAWRCDGGAHIIQEIVTRCVNSAFAALRKAHLLLVVTTWIGPLHRMASDRMGGALVQL